MKSFLVFVLFILAARLIFSQSPADIYAQLCEQAQAWQDPASPTATATPTSAPTPKRAPTKTRRINPALKIEPVTPLKP